jgi:hypothetical protein
VDNLATMASTMIHIATYSLTGNTQKAAEALLGLLDGDATSEVIVPVRPPRMNPVGFFRIGWGAWRGRSWPVMPPERPSPNARVLVVGTPVWAGRLPPPVRGWLGQAGAYPRLAVLITHGGSDVARVLADIESAAGRTVAARVALSDADRKAGKDASKLAWFAAEVRRLA